MSETTPRFALPLIASGQAQKHVPVNEALGRLDALIHLSVSSRDLSAPPSSPAPGDRYVIASGASGDWSGQAGKIASFDAGWQFLAPSEGWFCWDAGREELLVFTEGNWQIFSAGGGGAGGELQNVPRFGLGAEADEINPFTAKLNAALWTARETGDEGTGDLRYVMNKQASGNVLSILMQSAFSGRAEIGLIGDEDFLFKVSPDGTAWHDAIRIDRATGRPRFPAGGVREQLSADRTYYVRTDGSDANDGLANAPERAFATLTKAMNIVGSLDLGVHHVTVRLGNAGNFAGVSISAPWVGFGTVTLEGDPTSPASTVITSMILVENGARLTVRHFKTSISVLSNLRAQNNGIITLGPGLDFGMTASSHLHALNDGVLMAPFGGASYTISGGGQRHVQCDQATMNMRSGTVTLTGSPVFSVAYASLSVGAKVFHDLMTFSGAATGKRYDVSGNSVLATGGLTLPGSIAGTAASGGQYL